MQNLESLIEHLSALLTAKQLKITTAESCTGGLIAENLTAISGSSLWFERGFVTYGNNAKEMMLGVNPHLIQTYGAVSQLVAEAMASGALSHSESDIAVAVTGIAGPTGGSKEKPVGTVWLAWAYKDCVQSRHYHFKSATRKEVRQLACYYAVQGAISFLSQLAVHQ